MEKVIEEKFVNNFICKKAQNRILAGLACQEKRKSLKAGLSKLMDYINVDYVYLRDTFSSAGEIKNEIKKITPCLGNCYVIAGAYDGEIMPFEKAFYECFSDSLASVIIINDNLAFIKTETRNGESIKYILYKK